MPPQPSEFEEDPAWAEVDRGAAPTPSRAAEGTESGASLEETDDREYDAYDALSRPAPSVSISNRGFVLTEAGAYDGLEAAGM